MDKKFCASIFIISFIALSTIVYAQNRKPPVPSVVEIDMEDIKNGHPGNAGYDFSRSHTSEGGEKQQKRTPANIVSNHKSSPPLSYLGPILFLLTLPFAVWIIMAKKFNTSSVQKNEKNVEYYPKTYQFTPYKTDYQKSADEDEDINHPKAS